jgi:ABC-2 type transport system ATP-binding protein
MPSAVLLDNVTMRFDDFTAVDGLSLSVAPGEVLGVLGGNGAGKSTTMKAIAGVLKPFNGRILLKDLDVSDRKLAERAKSFTGYCPDVGGLILGATPREHIQLLLNLHRSSKPYGLALALLERVGLANKLDTPVGGFSHGESRRLSALLAALSAEEILVLDEPFDGVDPEGVDAINSLIYEARDSGLAVLVSTHLQPLLVKVSDRIIIMRKGHVMAEEPAEYFQGEEGVERYERLLKGI